VQEFILFVVGDMHGLPSVAVRGYLCLNQVGSVEDQRAPRAISSLSSREGGCGVVDWQGLKMDSGDITDLMPRA
jgi:hypothetical protein